MSDIEIGWHGPHWWSGRDWYYRLPVDGYKTVVGVGKTKAEAELDAKRAAAERAAGGGA